MRVRSNPKRVSSILFYEKSKWKFSILVSTIKSTKNKYVKYIQETNWKEKQPTLDIIRSFKIQKKLN